MWFCHLNAELTLHWGSGMTSECPSTKAVAGATAFHGDEYATFSKANKRQEAGWRNACPS